MSEIFSFEFFVTVLGVAISAGGFVQVFFIEGAGKRRIIFLSTTLALLFVLFITAAYDFYRHEEDVRQTSDNIIDVLQRDGYVTIDQLYSEIFPAVPYSTLTEAVTRLVEDGVMRHEIEDFNIRNGSVIEVRVYSLN